MRSRVIPRLVASLCAAAVWGYAVHADAPRQAAQEPPPAAISGVVVDAMTGQSIAGAVVSLGRLDVQQSQPRAVTDARGRFVFPNLAASDSYYLGARRFGFAYTRYGWSGPNQSLTISDIARIALAPGQWVRDIRIPLWRLGSISGRVRDERGEPVVGVAVRAFSRRSIAGTQQLVAGPIATTDDRGVYRISDLDPGAYVINVPSVQSTVLATTQDAVQTLAVGELATGGIGGGSGRTVSMPAIDVDGRHRLVMTNFATPPPPSSDAARAYPPVFHPGARAAADAATITIEYGDSLSGVDIQIQPVAAVRVSGRLEGADGAPPRLLLRLMPKGAERLGFGSEVATTTVDADGTFTFLNVPGGDYTLLAQASVMDFTSGSASTRFPDAPGFPAGGIAVGSSRGVPGLEYLSRRGASSAFWARASVGVGAADIDDLVVPLRRAVQVRGRVVFAPGSEASSRVLLRAQPANGDPSLGSPTGATSSTDPALPFTIDGLLGGTYVLDSFTGHGVVSIVSNGKDVTWSGIDASEGRDFDDVIVTLTSNHATLAGRVTDTRAVRGTVAVIAFPVNRARWSNYGWDPPDFRSGRARSDGAYEIARLAEGEYFVVAVDGSLIDAWVDPKWLEAAAPRATRVAIKWGEKRTLDLPVIEVSR